ncbi:MAG: IS1595 family transposase [Gammaproteobacteria bacterium]|nr:IS1595 family transposase [Gammaproteobacteria bacterium]
MANMAPGKFYREGIDLLELMQMFPDEGAAVRWFEAVRWANGRCCGKCGSSNTVESNHPKMPYWCTDCRSYFSVRTGTPIARSRIPLQKWAIAIYLCLTSLKSVSSMKLHRDLGISQPSAWFMLHRIREAWASVPGDGGNGEMESEPKFEGPVEVDETYMGGIRKNMSKAKRRELAESAPGRGAVGKTAVVGAKDRDSNRVSAKVIRAVDRSTLHEFVEDTAAEGAAVYTDEAVAYEGMPFDHEAVKHSVGEYVRDMIHTNGVESFWSMLKRAHKGTFHKLSPKHLDRYVQEFAAKHNMRESGTLAQMRNTVAAMVGRNLLYTDLIADNGLPSGARS